MGGSTCEKEHNIPALNATLVHKLLEILSELVRAVSSISRGIGLQVRLVMISLPVDLDCKTRHLRDEGCHSGKGLLSTVDECKVRTVSKTSHSVRACVEAFASARAVPSTDPNKHSVSSWLTQYAYNPSRVLNCISEEYQVHLLDGRHSKDEPTLHFSVSICSPGSRMQCCICPDSHS
jgi:hypothetical protein